MRFYCVRFFTHSLIAQAPGHPGFAVQASLNRWFSPRVFFPDACREKIQKNLSSLSLGAFLDHGSRYNINIIIGSLSAMPSEK
jgi:hypothetical protein